ncbi:MAG: hypothetical protein GY851_13725, partial [bacterium]|nr:hypothetical protein [bacterium]
MSEGPYNANDEAFLFSRSLDEELTGPEREHLEQALATSEALREEARQLRAVDHLVKRLGSEAVELDWESFTALTQA